VALGNSVTERAAQGMESVTDATFHVLLDVFKISEEMLVGIFEVMANLGFSAVMLWGFYYLPPDAMLLVGVITFIFGPALVLLGLQLVGVFFFVAGHSPMVFVALLFFLSFLRSRMWQTIGRALGFDRDGDGKITWHDAVHACRNQGWYIYTKETLASTGWVQLESLEEIEAQPDDARDTRTRQNGAQPSFGSNAADLVV